VVSWEGRQHQVSRKFCLALRLHQRFEQSRPTARSGHLGDLVCDLRRANPL